MATGYVPELQKIAGGMGVVERGIGSERGVSVERGIDAEHGIDAERGIGVELDDKRPTYSSDICMRSLSEVEVHAKIQDKGSTEMEAVAMVWSKKWLWAAYASIMLVAFVNSLQQLGNYTARPYVTSAFQKHGLTAMTDIVANIIGGVSKLPLAKFIDVVGRPQGFLLCVVCVVLGLTLMAICQNVQTFCAAQVVYWIGMNGIDYIQNVFIADTSVMENRLIWIALTGLPYVVNTYAGPTLGQVFLNIRPKQDYSWRWFYGAFAIITPFVCLTFWTVFFLMGRRAKTMGLLKKRPKSNRTVMQSIKYWCVEFDVVGLFLISSGFSVFLLPWPLEPFQEGGYGSPLVVCMIVFGVTLMALFVIWERFFATKSFFPYRLLTDRSVLASCFLGCNSWIAFYSYKMYYSSYLQVVFQLTPAKAGYITNIFFIVSCTWAVVISFAFKYTNTYKWGAMIAMPLQIAMTGLLIKLRAPGSSIALLVMVEVLGAMASAMILQIEQIAIMVAVPHENVAVGLALLSVITAVGGAIGQSVSGALWSQILPDRIYEYLPEASKDQADRIFGDLRVQIALPWGSPEREALVHAYADVQKTMLIFGTCALVPCFFWVAMLKNSRMTDAVARKGLHA